MSFDSLLHLGVVGDTIWFASSCLQWWYFVAVLLWQHLFYNGHLHVSITVKNTDGVDRDHLVKRCSFVYRFFGWDDVMSVCDLCIFYQE